MANCRWATRSEQNFNTIRAERGRITIGDWKMSMAEWCSLLGTYPEIIRRRERKGMSRAAAIQASFP